MYLVDPVDLQNIIGAQGVQPAGSLQLALLLAIQDNLRPLIEASMNVRTLDYVSNIDTFVIERNSDSDRARAAEFEYYNRYEQPLPREEVFRLENGLLDITVPITVTDPNGILIDPSYYTVDYELGTVALTKYFVGIFVVTYTSGLKVTPVPSPAVATYLPLFLGVPKWMKSLMVSQFVLWIRTEIMQIRIPDTVSYAAVAEDMHRAIATRIYSSYMRPRAEVTWTKTHRQTVL